MHEFLFGIFIVWYSYTTMKIGCLINIIGEKKTRQRKAYYKIPIPFI